VNALYIRTQPPLPTTQGYWLGLKENGSASEWIDGTPYGFTFWESGFPKIGQFSPYVSTAANDTNGVTVGRWGTDFYSDFYSKSLACLQKPIGGMINVVSICPDDTYYGMGEIRSPGYPQNFTAGLTCLYTLYDLIVADPDMDQASYYRTKLALYFIKFEIGTNDTVELFDGSSTSASLIARLSGTDGEGQHYYGTAWNMTLRFTSVEGNRPGWRAIFGPYGTKP